MNRNEAKEAVTGLRRLKAEVEGKLLGLEMHSPLYESMREWTLELEKSALLIEKFAAKHQPEVQRWK
jgi:hypothetical protein